MDTTPPQESPAGEAKSYFGARSPLLDWIAILRGGWLRIAVCCGVGFAVFYVLGMIQPVLYRSESVLVTQPDLLGTSAAQIVDVPGAQQIKPLTASQIFDRVASSAVVLRKTLKRLESEKGYDNLVEMELDDRKEELAKWPEKLDFVVMGNIRGDVLTFEYSEIDPTIIMTVSAPVSAKYARDFATILIEEATKRLGEIRSTNRSTSATDIEGARKMLDEDLEKAQAELVTFLRDNRLATDPATTQKRQDLQRDIEMKRGLFEQFKRLEEKFLFTNKGGQSLVTLVDGPSLPIVPTRFIPPMITRALGLIIGFFTAMLWIAYDAHVQAMRRINPGLYGGFMGVTGAKGTKGDNPPGGTEPSSGAPAKGEDKKKK